MMTSILVALVLSATVGADDLIPFDGVMPGPHLVSLSEGCANISNSAYFKRMTLDERRAAIPELDEDGLHLLFGPGRNLRELLRSPDIHRELKIASRDELAAIGLVREETRQRDREFRKRHASRRNPLILSEDDPDGLRRDWRKRWREDEKYLEEALGTERAVRVKQIFLRLNGLPKALNCAEVRRAIGMPEAEARAIFRETDVFVYMKIEEKWNLRLNRDKDLNSGETIDAALKEYMETRATICRDRMSKSQRDKWDALLGPRLPEKLKLAGFEPLCIHIENSLYR